MTLAMRQGIQFRPINVLNRNAALFSQRQNVFDLFTMSPMTDKDELKPPLIRPQRGENGFTAFKMFHSPLPYADLANCLARRAMPGSGSPVDQRS